MPSPKSVCPVCSGSMSPRALACRQCRPPYERTEAHRQEMSAALSGIPKPTLRGRLRPQHSAAMIDWWTPERREEKRLKMLQRNPNARYHGLSAKAAARLVRSAGVCHRCGHDGSESRLGVHHIDRDKRNQAPENIEVLCHRCHMNEHAEAAETGWDVYHRNRRQT